MNRITLWLKGFALMHLLSLNTVLAANGLPVDYVDPLLNKPNSRWMLFPGPTLPFGLVKLSPHNEDHPGWYKGGYEYGIDNIAGFSHIHSWTMAGLSVMPITGSLTVKQGPQDDPDKGYRSRYVPEETKASPGYYAVKLTDYDVKAEFTTTTRAGFHRYTFPESENSYILMDLKFVSEYGFSIKEAMMKKVSGTEIEGYSNQVCNDRHHPEPWQDYTVHFVIRFNRPFENHGFWKNEQITQGEPSISCDTDADVGAYVHYQTDEGDVVAMQVGISLVSIEQARLNLDTEMKPYKWDFQAVRKNTRRTWNELLGLIEVEGGTHEDKVKFYTNLYRSYSGRTIFSDVDGKYVDMCEQVRQMPYPDTPIMGCDAFWNTFWNLNQLWNLVNPDISETWVRSLLEIYEHGGWLPKGPAGIEYSSIMVASHEIPLMVAAYQHGIRGYDVEKAYQAMKHIQTTRGMNHPCGGSVGNQHIKPYMDLGYVPHEAGPVSNTLEYAYDDWCVAQMAKALNKGEDYAYFMERSKNYRNVFNSEAGYVCPRYKDGSWIKDFNPFIARREVNDPDRSWLEGMSKTWFVEGNSWQYTWFVPHDVNGLIDLTGREEFNRRLNEGFEKSEPHRFGHVEYQGTPKGVNEFYVHHGNQPNMQAAYLFNFSGKPWLTQKWARSIMESYYGTGPQKGYLGDEDQGQMGAWFVMSAMGLFQMDGGCSAIPAYQIGSPLFDKIIIHLNPAYYPGKTFTIECRNNSKENRYVQQAELDGMPWNAPRLYLPDLVDGGRLVLDMGPEPNKNWGVE